MGRRAHQPDPSLQRQVEAMAAYGIPELDIGRVLKIDPKTLRKHYRHELEFGHLKANAQVAGFLFNSARNGNVAAQIFWLKTRARWNEPASEHTHIAAIARIDVESVPDEELERIRDMLAQLTPRDHEILEALAQPSELDRAPGSEPTYRRLNDRRS